MQFKNKINVGCSNEYIDFTSDKVALKTNNTSLGDPWCSNKW